MVVGLKTGVMIIGSYGIKTGVTMTGKDVGGRKDCLTEYRYCKKKKRRWRRRGGSSNSQDRWTLCIVILTELDRVRRP